MTRRTNHVMREFIDLVESRIAGRRMSLDRAAELLIEHGVPTHVASRIISRAQAPYPALSA